MKERPTLHALAVYLAVVEHGTMHAATLSQSLPSVHLQYRWQENGVVGAEHDGRFSLQGKQSSKWDTGKVGHFLATAKANPCRGCCG